MSTELNTAEQESATAQPRHWRQPRYHVAEQADHFEVTASIPGVGKEGVDISLHEDTLTMVATRQDASPEAWRPLHRELPNGDYRLSLRLKDVRIDEAKIAAQVANGLLTLTLPKAEEVKPRKIQVN